jgi:hypothetical protein
MQFWIDRNLKNYQSERKYASRSERGDESREFRAESRNERWASSVCFRLFALRSKLACSFWL